MEDETKPGLPGFLKGLVDGATGVFLARADLEDSRNERDIALANLRATELLVAEKAAAQDQFNGVASSGGVNFGNIDPSVVMLGVAALVGVLLISRL